MKPEPNVARPVYLPKVDADHQAILRVLEELGRAMSEGAGTEKVHGIIKGLLHSVALHFSYEERMMRTCSYSALEWHKRQHDTARRRLRDYAGRAERGDDAAVLEMLDFLNAWLPDHTNLHDCMMAAYLRNFERA